MTSNLRKSDIMPSKKNRNWQIAQVDPACVQDNSVLSMSVNENDVDRCINIIRQYGLLTPPVVGNLANGSRILLSGECEFMALREMGAKHVEAVTIEIVEKDEGDKISLLLASLKKSPNALSEGILITQLFRSGAYTQFQLAKLLGKSVSWVNKRISLITRLDPAVKELVKQGQLCSHSAQVISRLPIGTQHSFSVAAVREGLPKSSIETLVAAFNSPRCPMEVKKQIVSAPHRALIRLTDIRSARKARGIASFIGIEDEINVLRQRISTVVNNLTDAPAGVPEALLDALRNELLSLLSLVDKILSFSPGKTEGRDWANGH